MARRFGMVDYEKSLDQTVTIRDVLPPDHLARFIVQVIAMLDVSAIYAGYAPVGGEAYAPELDEGDGYYYELEDFIGGVEKGRLSGVVTAQSAAEAVRLCLAEIKSANTGREISFP